MGGSGYPNFPDIRLPKLNPQIILLAVAGIVVLIALATSVFTVAPDEVGVIQRFGKYLGTADQGLHFKLPFFIDNVTNVKTTFVYKQEFGFRTARAGVQSEFVTTGEALETERLSLTGDLNVVAVEWVMQYTIADAYNYLFKVRDPEGTIRAASETVIKEVLGDYTVDEVITTAREEVAAKAKVETQKLLDNYEMGINVVDLKLRNVNPPTREVQDAFEEVNRAEQRRDELINNAEAEYNATIPRARGQAQQRIEQAIGAKQARINVALGDASQFEQIRIEYNKAREVTRQRLYLEAWNEILPKLGRKIIIDGDLRGLIQLLNLQEAVKEGGAQ
jgi:membrane protease subunit HflK